MNLQVTYAGNVSLFHGSKEGRPLNPDACVTLLPGEQVSVSGYSNDQMVVSITFQSTAGQTYGPYGADANGLGNFQNGVNPFVADGYVTGVFGTTWDGLLSGLGFWTIAVPVLPSGISRSPTFGALTGTSWTQGPYPGNGESTPLPCESTGPRVPLLQLYSCSLLAAVQPFPSCKTPLSLPNPLYNCPAHLPLSVPSPHFLVLARDNMFPIP